MGHFVASIPYPTIREGRIRSASLTSRRSRIPPVPSRLGWRTCRPTTSGSGSFSAVPGPARPSFRLPPSPPQGGPGRVRPVGARARAETAIAVAGHRAGAVSARAAVLPGPAARPAAPLTRGQRGLARPQEAPAGCARNVGLPRNNAAPLWGLEIIPDRGEGHVGRRTRNRRRRGEGRGARVVTVASRRGRVAPRRSRCRAGGEARPGGARRPRSRLSVSCASRTCCPRCTADSGRSACAVQWPRST